MFSSETREEAICRLYADHHSIDSIRQLTGIRYERVSETIKFYEQNHVPPPPMKRGRRAKINNDALTKIATLTLQNRGIPCWLISKRLKEEGIHDISTGPKWTIISKLFEDRSPSSLRLRYHYLYKH